MMQYRMRERNSAVRKRMAGPLFLCLLLLISVTAGSVFLPAGIARTESGSRSCSALSELTGELHGSVLPLTAEAAEHHGESKNIAIVFDNSGSMYATDAWCKATYSMEVFADMLNEGDTLEIYPMNSVQAQSPSGSGTSIYTMDNPIVIRGGTDPTGIIEGMRSHVNDDLDTPVEAIERASDGLRKKPGSPDSKYLVVLTDGASFYRNGTELTARADTEAELTRVLGNAGESANVLYVGIGSDVAMPQLSTQGEGGLIAKSFQAENSDQILARTTEVCNTIFGRITADQAVSGNTVDADIPLSSLIVFTQGGSGSSVSVSGSDGQLTPTKTYSPKYSTDGSLHYTNEPVDTRLTGSVVTYTSLPADTYTISGTGSNTEVYYEPDVDLKAELYKPDGSLWTKDDELVPGTYQLDLYFADSRGNRLPNSTLLGDQAGKAYFSAEYATLDSDGVLTDRQEAVMDGSTGDSTGVRFSYEVKPGGNLGFGKLRVSYVNNYVIEKDAEEDFGLRGIGEDGGPKGENAKENPRDLEVSIEGPDSVGLSDLEKSGHYSFTARVDGQDVDNAVFNAELSESSGSEGPGTGPVTLSPEDGGSGASLHYAEGGLAATASGTCVLKVTASWEDPDAVLEENRYLTAEAEKTITVSYEAPVLDIELDHPRTCTLRELSEGTGKPIIVKLQKNGGELSTEELLSAAVKVSIQDENGNTLKITDPVPGSEESTYEVTLSDPDAQTGTYHIQADAKVVGQDGILLDASTDGSDTIKVSRFPAWFLPLIILIIAALIIALIAALVYRYRHTPVLPNEILFRKKGKLHTPEGDKNCPDPPFQFRGGGERTGSVSIQLPKVPGHANWVCSLSFRVEPTEDSFRYKPSSERRMKVVSVSGSPAKEGTEFSLDFGTKVVYRNKKWVDKRSKDADPEAVLGDGSMIKLTVAATGDLSGPVTLQGNLSFRDK